MYTIIAQPMTKRKGRNREKKKILKKNVMMELNNFDTVINQWTQVFNRKEYQSNV